MYYKELARRLRRRYLDSLGNVVLQNRPTFTATAIKLLLPLLTFLPELRT